MSCKACEHAQEPDITNSVTRLNRATYVRIGNGNVLVSGCQKHVKELAELLRKAQSEKIT